MPSIVRSQGEGDFTPIDAGTHIGRCHQVINLGVHAAGPWKPKPKHYIAFEIPSERVTWTDKENVEHEGPAIVGARYTSSLSPKAVLRQQLESWRGALFTEEQLASFDLFNLIGVPALISVVHSDDGKYANITALMKLPRGMQCLPAELPTLAYDPQDQNAAATFQQLTNRMQDTVTRGQENATIPAAPTHAPPPARAPGSVYVPHPESENPVPGHVLHEQRNGSRPTGRAPNFHEHAQDFDDDIPF